MTVPLFDEFEHLAGSVVDGTASPVQIRRFNSILRESPELGPLYFEQVRMHAALTLRGEGRFLDVRLPFHSTRAKGSAFHAIVRLFVPHPHRFRRALPWLLRGGIAAILFLFVGTLLWQVVRQRQEDEIVQNEGTTDFPVNLMSCKNILGLATPDAVPGKIRLQSGCAKIRLSSGVEITFIGETDMDVRSDMEVVLNRGRALAFVPSRASGFTLRMSRMTVWDIGTIFVASAEPGGEGVLVFKGSVQVLDGAGEGLQLCTAGEGVQIDASATPESYTFSMDKTFKSYSGSTALADPEATIMAASTLLSQGQMTQQKSAGIVKPIPFSKDAWVRPSPTQLKEETTSMTTKSTLAIMAAGAMLAGTGVSASSTPIRVDTAINQQRHWSTVFTNEVPLRWVWPSGATSVDLEITGLTTTFTTNMNVSASNYVWKVFTGAVPLADDLYTLTLTFRNSGATLNVQTAQLAVVKAAFGPTEVSTDYMEAKLWTKARSTMVIPYDASWTAATVGAATSQLLITRGGMSDVTYPLAASGYHGWNIEKGNWGFGTFALALTFPGIAGAQWDASLIWNPKGTLIRLM